MAYGTQPNIAVNTTRNYAPMAEPDTIERNPQIASELGSLEKATAILNDRVTKLYSRLTPILSSTGDGQCGQGVPEPSRCQLADSLYAQVKLVTAIDATIAEILQRLEL